MLLCTESVLPNNIFFIPDMPLVPTTIKSILCSSAYSTIDFTTDVSMMITSVLRLMLVLDALFFTSSTCFCPPSTAIITISLRGPGSEGVRVSSIYPYLISGDTTYNEVNSASCFSAR